MLRIRSNVLIAEAGILNVGENTAINESTIIACYHKISIVKDVMISPKCYLLNIDHNYESTNLPIREQGYITSPIATEDDVWLGTQIVVTKGIKIGNRAIIAANSIITKNISPDSIVGVVPANVVKQR